MYKINMDKIKATLPKHGTAVLHKKDSTMYIVCKIERPTLSEAHPKTFEKDFEMILDWQSQIVGEALCEFYTHTTAQHWEIWLKRIPIEFEATTDEDAINVIKRN